MTDDRTRTVIPKCEYSGLGIIADQSTPAGEFFAAHCRCGAHVTVVHGRIPVHEPGVDEGPCPT